MIDNSMDILQLFPVRKSKAQKQAFRDAVQAYASRFGYDFRVEQGSMGARNVIIGNPDTAAYLVTAHYDTCARLPFPNFITPCNLWVYLGYQLLIVALFFAVASVVGFAVMLIVDDSLFAFYAAYISYFGMLFLMMAGPANKHNANDNTSGVVTLLEILRSMPEARKDQVCFVLFDLEEVGLIGSASYRKAHKKATENQVILNLDCVGDGTEIMMFPSKKLTKDSKKLEALGKICGKFGKKSLKLHRKGFSICPSDHKNFPLGVGIMAFNRKKGVGLYCDRIHTNRDTILDLTNVNILRAAIITLICQ